MDYILDTEVNSTHAIYKGPLYQCCYCHTLFISNDFLEKHFKKCINNKIMCLLKMKLDFKNTIMTDNSNSGVMRGEQNNAILSLKPRRKRAKIDLEMKMKIINKYEGGYNMSATAHQFGLSSSTISSIVKDANRIKEHVMGLAPLKSTIITKQRTGAIYQMEQLLKLWLQEQIQNRIQLNLQSIRAKARSIYEDIKANHQDASKQFLASTGWFARFKHRAGLHFNISRTRNRLSKTKKE